MKESPGRDSQEFAVDPQRLAGLVTRMQETAQELLDQCHGIQAIERNTKRILASLRMLQLNLGCDTGQEPN